MTRHTLRRCLLSALFAWAPAAAQALDRGDVHEGSIEYQNVSVPLPPGQWTVVNTVNTSDQGSPNFPMGQAILASNTAGAIDRVVKVWVQRKKQATRSFDPYAPCSSNGYFHAEVAANSGSALDCWHVRALSLGLKGRSEPANEALFEYGADNKLFVPVVMIGARFARKDDSDRRYYVEYLWTPDLLLPADTAAKVWVPDDWSKDAVSKDPRKLALIDAVTEWAKEWRARFK